MSVPVMSNYLSGMLGSGMNGSSSGSGVVNFGSGFNLSSLFGGSGSGSSGGASGLSGILGGLTGLLGPAGLALGVVPNLIPGLDGFLQNGFDFTCLGAQAFNKQDLEGRLNMLKSEVDKTNRGDLSSVESLFNWCAYQKGWADKSISTFKSGCSKSLMTKFKEAVSNTLEELKGQFSFTLSSVNGDSHMGQFQIEKYKLNGSTSVQTVGAPVAGSVTVEQFNTDYVPQIQEYALQNNLNVDDAIQTAYTSLFPKGGVWGSGGVGGDDWQVGGSFGNKEPNYMLYVLIAVGGLFALKMFKK